MRKKTLGYIIFHIGLVAAMMGIFCVNYFQEILEFILINSTRGSFLAYYLYSILVIAFMILVYKLMDIKIDKFIIGALLFVLLGIIISLLYSFIVIDKGFTLINSLENVVVNIPIVTIVVVWIVMFVAIKKVNEVELRDDSEKKKNDNGLKYTFFTLTIFINILFSMYIIGICSLGFAFTSKEEISVNIDSKNYICRIEYPFLGSSDEVYYTYYKKINLIILEMTNEVSGEPVIKNN